MNSIQKIILITGASSGIGKESAKLLIGQGHTVYCAARSVDKMQDLQALGGKLLKMDIVNSGSVEKAVEKVIKEQGKIDVLFNNAGFGSFGSVEETPIKDAKYQFDVNLFGLAHITQLIIPHMRKQKSGLIINTSSIGGKMHTPLAAWYHATKFALEGWSDSLRLELSPFKINVVVIEPGSINTGFRDVVISFFKSSKNSPYKNLIQALMKRMKKRGNSSHPLVIAKLVLKAVQSKKPKTRYSGGKHARTSLFFRKILSDRLFDKLILSQYKA